MLGSRAIISIYLAHFDATSPKERKNQYFSFRIKLNFVMLAARELARRGVEVKVVQF
jgi:hypothetical protein